MMQVNVIIMKDLSCLLINVLDITKLKLKRVCCAGFRNVWKNLSLILRGFCQYFLSCQHLIFFPLRQVLFLPDCARQLIDNWLQSHSGLLKYQAEASSYRPRPQASLLCASGRLAPLEPSPVIPIQTACFVYLHHSCLPTTYRPSARWGWQGVNTDKNMATRERDR